MKHGVIDVTFFLQDCDNDKAREIVEAAADHALQVYGSTTIPMCGIGEQYDSNDSSATVSMKDYRSLKDSLEQIANEIAPAKAYAESYGLEGGKLPSAVHIKLDMIAGYAREALTKLEAMKPLELSQ